jgi:hypothetical protein
MRRASIGGIIERGPKQSEGATKKEKTCEKHRHISADCRDHRARHLWPEDISIDGFPRADLIQQLIPLQQSIPLP